MTEAKEQTKEQILELLKGYRPTTKRGGYKEIPRKVILKAAEQIGIPEKDIPQIRVENMKMGQGGYIHKTPQGEIEIVVPRREPKQVVPDTLRHELAHAKNGFVVPSTWENYIEDELKALKLQGNGRLTCDDISGLILTLVLEDKQPKRETTHLVTDTARYMGASEHSITSAKRFLRRHWRRLEQLKEYL